MVQDHSPWHSIEEANVRSPTDNHGYESHEVSVIWIDKYHGPVFIINLAISVLELSDRYLSLIPDVYRYIKMSQCFFSLWSLITYLIVK